MKVMIIAESKYKGQIYEADIRPNMAFPYRIKIDGLWMYWRNEQVEVIKDEVKDEPRKLEGKTQTE